MIRVTINHSTVREKPSNDNKTQAEIIRGFVVDAGTVQELAEDVVRPNSKTWCPAVFSQGGVRANKYWASQQVFALDFDSGITPDKVLARCEEYRIFPAFMYSSFSDTKEARKFRVVFVLPIAITNAQIRDIVQRGFLKVFPEADQSCKEAARMYYGGKEIIYSDYNVMLDVSKLIDAICIHVQVTDYKNARKNIESWCQQVGLNITNGYPDVRRESKDTRKYDDSSSVYVYYTDEMLSYNLAFNLAPPRKISRDDKVKYSNITNTEIEYVLIRGFDWQELIQRCEVTRDFINGIDVHRDVTWTVMTNFIRMEGGAKKFLEGICKRDVYDLNKWRYQINYERARSALYPPIGYSYIAEWYPHAAETAQARTIVEAAKLNRGMVNVYEVKQKKSLAQAEAEYREAFDVALEADDTNVYALCGPTGLGKTELYLDLPDATIVLPTHKLKNEVAARMVARGRIPNQDFYVSPELPDEEVTEVLDRLYEVGAIKSASKYVRELSEENPTIAEYVKQKDLVDNTNNVTVLTTHARLFYLHTQNKTIVIDEDILPAMLKQGRTTLEDLYVLAGISKKRGFGSNSIHIDSDFQTLRSIINVVEKSDINIVSELPKTRPYNKKKIEVEAVRKNISTNVIEFLECTHFIKDTSNKITFVNRRNLPENKKVIVLSATLNETLYKLAFGERLRFFDIGLVETKGRILQDTRYSYSRTQLFNNKYSHLFDEAQQVANEYNAGIITFKVFEEKFNNVLTTFGGLTGIDEYKGGNIVVVGTPHMNPDVYVLTAMALDIPVNACDYSMEMAVIRRKGFEYYFTTYSKNLLLQEVQLHLIESELIQAIGRARVLRYDCTVIVLANLPIEGAHFIAA
jgi:hypothetical protein